MIPRQWPGETVVVAGTGPSLTKQDLDCCIGRARVLVVNDAWRLAPWADALYGADHRWWDHWQGVPDFKGQKWTQDRWEGREPGSPYDLNVVELRKDIGLCRLQAVNGSHGGGYQAINLAYHFGAGRILLLGFDMSMAAKKHFFGNYPGQMNLAVTLENYAKDYGPLAHDLREEGVEVINCTLGSKLTQFPKKAIHDAL